MRATSLRNRLGRGVGSGTALLLLIYTVSLLPERRSVVITRADRSPFAWHQDQFWSELEQQFVAARTLRSHTLTNRVAEAVSELGCLLEKISEEPVLPQDVSCVAIETNLFRLAPLVAAWPDGLPDFISLVNRVRREVKTQSEQWDLSSPIARERLYRLLFGSRMALEEIMLQTPAAKSPRQLIRCDEEPSQTPIAEILGLTVHSGDILVSRGGAATSALIARGNDYPGCFSHAGLIHVDERSGRVSVIESLSERGVAVTPIEQYLKDKKLRIMVLRLRSDVPAVRADPMVPHRAATAALQESQRRHVPYDFSLDYRDHRAQFCAELVSAAYERVGIQLWMGLTFISSPTVTAWLSSLGVRHFETQEPADFEFDPQLRVVAEWRDLSTLFKAHVDDAVTDVMLSEAKPGQGLPYQKLLLPFARAMKAYSVLLNTCGQLGPVPEGMSATVALRIRKYRHQHAAIADRALVLAERFQQQRGYSPPYWELVRLARQAKHELGDKPA
jgi:hypothetical protein